jgi:hypothetical protein
MEAKVFEIEKKVEFDLFKYIVDEKFGLILIGLYVLIALFFILNPRLKNNNIVPAKFSLIFLTGFFCLKYALIDEVFINLEHSYNLFHFGKFSFSPTRGIDSTVEPLFYLLHFPFGSSQQLLVFGNFLISLICSLLLYFNFRYLFIKATNWSNELLIILCFAGLTPILLTSATGFGNVLFFLAITQLYRFYLDRKYTASLIMLSILPLIRPEAIIYTVLILGHLNFISSEFRAVWKKQLAFLLLTAVSFSLYSLFYKTYYGSSLPTPLVFKSLTKNHFTSVYESGTMISNIILQVKSFIFYRVVLLAIIFLLIAEQLLRGKISFFFQRNFSVIGCYTYLAIIFSFLLTETFFGDGSFYTRERYLILADFFLVLFMVHLAQSSRIIKAMPSTKYLNVLLVICILIAADVKNTTRFSETKSKDRYRTDNFLAAKIYTEVFGNRYVAGSTEQNTFGFMLDSTEVIDLWGYSNDSITKASPVNRWRVKNEPAYFQQQNIEIYYPYWLVKKDTIVISKKKQEYLDEFMAFDQVDNFLGDKKFIVDNYNLWVIRTANNMEACFLVKKTVENTILANMQSEITTQ